MSKSKPPYFAFYPLDFVGDENVELMSTQAVGAYILLLCKAWHQDPPASLPDDDRVLSRWARLTPDEWTEIKPEVLRAFTPGGDGRLHQKRLRQEYEAFKAKSRKASRAAQTRWQQCGRNADAYANAPPTHCDSNARAFGSESGSGSSPSEGESVRGGAPPDGGIPPDRWPQNWVAEIFQAYPKRRRGGPREARLAIGEALSRIEARFNTPSDAAEWLRRRVEAFASSDEGKGQYLVGAKRWFDSAKYDQDDAEWQADAGDPATPKERILSEDEIDYRD